MDIDEAKARVAAQDEKLRVLEGEIARLAAAHATPVFLAILSALVETVCAARGEHFSVIYKIKFYDKVMVMLRQKGIS